MPSERTVVVTDGAARLERWDLTDTGALFTPTLPDAPVYQAFRAAPRERVAWRPISYRKVHHLSDRIGLGMPTLSTADVSLFRHLVDDLALRSAWVTNGVYTAEVPAADVPRFEGRD